MRILAVLLGSTLALAACAPPPSVAPDGTPLQQIYRIKQRDTGRIQFRMLDAVNALRNARGLSKVELSSELNAAAATHALDMSVQNRPWHFGSDGSSPLQRVARSGYPGRMLGENISETYETELETLAAWMEEAGTRDVILAPSANDLGLGWHQEDNGKIWWTMLTGERTAVFGFDEPAF